MKAKEILERICKELQETITPQWNKVELISKVNTIGHFEPTDSNDAFVESDQYRYPKGTKVWGIEIFVDSKCIFREYDIIDKNETDTEAEDRIAQKAIINIGYEFIMDRIKISKDFILYP